MGHRDLHRAGICVQARRGQLGLTQEQLATDAGVDPKTISSLEAGRTWPWPRHRAAIERALCWPPMTLESVAAGGDPPALTPEEERIADAYVEGLRRARSTNGDLNPARRGDGKRP